MSSENNGVIWWKKLTNSSHLINDIRDSLWDGSSVVISCGNIIPWQNIMIEIITQKVGKKDSMRTFDIYNASDIHESSGDFLFGEYLTKDEQEQYWPFEESRASFLARNKITVLNRRFVCIYGISSDKAKDWISFISEYLKYSKSNDEHGVFLLFIKSENIPVSKIMKAFKYEEYITDYDCMMMCLTLVSSLSCSRSEKMYLCEAASNLARNNVEIAGVLVEKESELIQSPLKAAYDILRQSVDHSEMEDFVNSAIWEAQIKFVFPKLENFRSELIKKYESDLKKCLPIRSSNGEEVYKPSDLEIGQLYYLCTHNPSRIDVSQNELRTLEKMRDARNKIAHRETLSYDKLKSLCII